MFTVTIKIKFYLMSDNQGFKNPQSQVSQDSGISLNSDDSNKVEMEESDSLTPEEIHDLEMLPL